MGYFISLLFAGLQAGQHKQHTTSIQHEPTTLVPKSKSIAIWITRFPGFEKTKVVRPGPDLRRRTKPKKALKNFYQQDLHVTKTRMVLCLNKYGMSSILIGNQAFT